MVRLVDWDRSKHSSTHHPHTQAEGMAQPSLHRPSIEKPPPSPSAADNDDPGTHAAALVQQAYPSAAVFADALTGAARPCHLYYVYEDDVRVYVCDCVIAWGVDQGAGGNDATKQLTPSITCSSFLMADGPPRPAAGTRHCPRRLGPYHHRRRASSSRQQQEKAGDW